MENETEVLPDIPNILTLLQSILDEIQEEDDISKITKRQLALNQTNILDSLIALSKYVVAKGYALEILDKAIAKKNTLEIDSINNDEEDNDEDIEETVKKTLDRMFA